MLGIGNARDVAVITLDPAGRPLPVLSTLAKALVTAARTEVDTRHAQLIDAVESAGNQATVWTAEDAGRLGDLIDELIAALEDDDTAHDNDANDSSFAVEEWALAGRCPETTEALNALLDYLERRFELCWTSD